MPPRLVRLTLALILTMSLAWLSVGLSTASAQDHRRGDRLRALRQLSEGAGQREALPPASRIDGPGDFRFVLDHGGRTRTFRVHVPAAYRRGEPTPMVLALHGGMGDMDLMADKARYGLVAKSDEAGFIVVFPNGASRLDNGKMATWNAGTCCGLAQKQDVDDVGFLRAVVGRMSELASIDRRGVFSVGMSNGAMMSYRLACEAPDLIRGIMAVAGTDNTVRCSPTRPVAVLHIHARNDDRVPFEGGVGGGFKEGLPVAPFASVPDTIARWVKLDRAEPAARRLPTPGGAICELHAARPGGDSAPVQLCITATGGHSWPGGVKRRSPPSQAISADDVMWEFFSRL